MNQEHSIQELEDKLKELRKLSAKDVKVIPGLNLQRTNLSETIADIRREAIDRKHQEKDAIVWFWGLYMIKQEVEQSPRLKENVTSDIWGNWEQEFGFSYLLFKKFPNPNKGQVPQISEYFNKHPQDLNDINIQKQILSYLPSPFLEAIKKDQGITDIFQEKLSRRCLELLPPKSKKKSSAFLTKAGSIEKITNGPENVDTMNTSTKEDIVLQNTIIPPQSLLSLLSFAKEQQLDNAYQDKIVNLIRETETDFSICDCLYKLAKADNQIGFTILLDSLIEVSGDEKIFDIGKMILSTENGEAVQNLYIEYVCSLSTERDSRFNLGDFIDSFLREPINHKTREFLSDICERISKYGRQNYKDAQSRDRELKSCKADNTKRVVYSLGESLRKIEINITNMCDSKERLVKETAEEIRDKIKDIYASLKEIIEPVTDIEDWVKQIPVEYNSEIHELSGELKEERKVRIDSIGLRSKWGTAIYKARVHSI